MAFTYDIASQDDDILALSRVRIELGDHVEDGGVLPDGANLQDEVIALYLTQNADDVAATVTALAGVVWRHWSTVADVTVGPRRESLSQVAKHWQTQAKGDAEGLSAVRAYFGVVSRGA